MIKLNAKQTAIKINIYVVEYDAEICSFENSVYLVITCLIFRRLFCMSKLLSVDYLQDSNSS